jgi:flagellar motor switch protein FliN/FliY
MTSDDLITRLAGELTRVVGALLASTASGRTGTASTEDGFGVTVTAAEGRGQLRIYFGRAGAEAFVKALTASPLEPTESQVFDGLQELCGQALATIDAPGAVLRVVSVEKAPTLPDPSQGIAVDIVARGHDQALRVTLVGDLTLGEPAVAQAPRSRTLDVIMDIDLPLVVRFGRTELPLKTLASLGPGSVIDLGRAPDDPVDVLISNRVVARGEVVIVAGNYGVRVHDVVSPAERARSLEAELS